MAAKLPAAAMTVAHHGRRVAGGQAHGQHAQAAADQDERRLRTQHDAQGQGGDGGQEDAGQPGRVGRAAGLEAVGRLVAATARAGT